VARLAAAVHATLIRQGAGLPSIAVAHGEKKRGTQAALSFFELASKFFRAYFEP
jgi:hypothetical protein